MQSDFYLSRVRGENDGPDILRVDNCSEVDVAGNFYKQDGKYYDDCCDLENEDAPECADSPWWAWLILSLFLMPWVLMGSYAIFRFFFMPLFCWIFRFCVKHCPEFICYNICCARCEPQPIDSNATRSRTESIDNISTISANIRQPPSRPPSPSAPPSSSSDIQEGLFDRLPRSKASEDQCTGRSNSCLICMDEYELDSDLVTLPCLHFFHYECSKQWLSRKNECPVCRTRVE